MLPLIDAVSMSVVPAVAITVPVTVITNVPPGYQWLVVQMTCGALTEHAGALPLVTVAETAMLAATRPCVPSVRDT